jgi:acetyl/propionyl-CoA carboxylase alpha subunit
MNTRLQVEHPITEETLGCDLVRAQLEVAQGLPLPDSWLDGTLSPRGHSIEMRLYAEDPEDFLPRSGKLLEYREPSGPGVRVDAGVTRGSVVGLEYDPLLAKLVVWAPDREAALGRARRALADWIVLGVETNLPLLREVLDSGEFASGRYATDMVSHLPRRNEVPAPDGAWITAALTEASARESAEGHASSTASDPWRSLPGWRVGA